MNTAEYRKQERQFLLKEQKRLEKLDRSKNNIHPNINVGLDSENYVRKLIKSS